MLDALDHRGIVVVTRNMNSNFRFIKGLYIQ